MKKLLFLLAFTFFFTVQHAFAQVPQGINYQTVIRDVSLNPLSNQSVSFLITFWDGSSTFYAETHNVQTDQLGMVQLPLGSGTPLSGSFDGMDWSQVTEVRIDLDVAGGTNYENLGSVPLQSVPFAFLAQDVVNKDDADADPTNEIQVMIFDQSTGELSLTGGNSVFVYDPANLDKDTTNELQALSMDSQSGELTLSNGNTVNVYNPNDNDPDPANELQQLAFDSASATLSISNGNQVQLPVVSVPDADADPTNELQVLSYDSITRVLVISDGNQVIIPSGGPDADADPTNELQGLLFEPATGELTISDGNTVNVYDPADLDKDPTNEIQMLELDTAAGTLTISGGNTIQLPAGGGGINPWQSNGNDIYYDNGLVGIGRIAGTHALEVEGNLWAGSSQGASLLGQNGFSFQGSVGQEMAFLGRNQLASSFYSGLAAQNKSILYLQDVTSDSCCVLGVMGVNNGDGTGLLELYGSSSKKINAYLGSALGCSDCGALELLGPNGGISVLAGASTATAGYLLTYGTNDQANSELGFLPGDPDQGALLLGNQTGLTTALLASTSVGGVMQLANSTSQLKLTGIINNAGSGSIFGLGNGGSFNFVMDNSISNADWGYVGVLNESSQEASGMTVTGKGEGLVFVLGTNGNANAAMTSVNDDSDAGFIGVFDAAGVARAGLFVDSLGQGTMFADVKNFRVPNPNDPGSEIWYASLEGPEVGAYTRGTETLENGQRFVAYPDYFLSMIDPTTVTVVLTPHEWDTYGLAVVEKQATGFVVRELKGGTGNFSFDWEVKAVRKGYEHFEVIRPKQKVENEVLPFSASSAKNEIQNTTLQPILEKK